MAFKATLVSIVKKYFTTAPIIFPLVGLFHIVLLIVFCFSSFTGDLSRSYFQLRPVVMGLYTWFWIGVCFLQKRYANSYLIFTIVMVCFYFFLTLPLNNYDGQGFFDTLYKNFIHIIDAVSEILLPANLLFSFLILFYYRRMKSPHPSKKEETLPNPEIQKKLA